MASRSRVLYVGVTSDLVRRVFQYKNGLVEGFTSKYRVNRLVYFEDTRNSRAAIARGREIKGWKREEVPSHRDDERRVQDLASSWFPVQTREIPRCAQDDKAALRMTRLGSG